MAVDAERALERGRGGRDRSRPAATRAAGRDPDRGEGLEDAAGYRTTTARPCYADAPPATDGLAQVARLRAAGCVVVGKTNMPEFGWSANTDQRPLRPDPQPVGTSTTAPAGSSGGSAAALAAGHGAAGHRLRRGRLDPHPLGRAAGCRA